jgi:hypothetical protein
MQWVERLPCACSFCRDRLCGEPCTLGVHVRCLQLKIENDPVAPCYLPTVRGVGYRFDVPEPVLRLTAVSSAVE